MNRWRALIVVLTVAAVMAIAAQAFAAPVVVTPPALCATITVPTHATIPGSGSNPNPIVEDVWVFDTADWQNGAVMTGSAASGGGIGKTNGGGVGGGGQVCVFGVINPNGNDLSTMAARGWLRNPKGADQAMTKLTEAEAAEWIEKAYLEGFINLATRDNLLLQVVNSHNWAIFRTCLPLSYHDPAGQYEGVVKALAGSAWDEEAAPFTYLDVIAMDVDYNMVEFGTVMPGAHKVITGDYDWGTTMPTAQNLGNVPLSLKFMYSEMKKVGGTDGDVLNEFDLELQATSWTDQEKEVWPLLNAGQWVTMNKALPICNRAKMNFSLDAPSNIQNGEYNGEFSIVFCKY